MDISTIISIGVSVFTACIVFYLQRSQNKRDRRTEERARIRQEESYHTMQMVKATMSLSRATAIAIRDHKCNGEMSAAMEYCSDADRGFTEFIRRQGAAHIHEK